MAEYLWNYPQMNVTHYDDVIMTMLASQITSLTVVYSIVHSGVNQRKHQSSASLAFVREIHRGPVNFPHKWPVTRKMFPFDDVIMGSLQLNSLKVYTRILKSQSFRNMLRVGDNEIISLIIAMEVRFSSQHTSEYNMIWLNNIYIF